MKFLVSTGLAMILLATPLMAQEEQEIPQSMKNRQWSLFYEYHKNKDYKSAIGFGMWMAKYAPDDKKTLWQRLNEALVNTALMEETLPENRMALLDTSMMILDMGIKYTPDKAQNFYLVKAYNYENYIKNPDSAIANYMKAIDLGPAGVDIAYTVMCGRLLVGKDMIQETIEFYTKMIDAYESGGNAEAAQTLRYELNGIAEPEKIIELNIEALKNEQDPEKRRKLLLQTAKLFSDNQKDDEKALPYIQDLIKLDPSASNYRYLGRTYQSLGNYSPAIKAYQEALKLEETKEDMINIAQAYVSLENGSAAREWARKALRVDRGLGRAYIIIGLAYEAAVSKCVSDKGGWTKMEFNDKVVYLAIEDAYEAAIRADESVAGEARQRISQNKKSNLYPTKEDYFLRQIKPGDSIQINSGCYGWIGETVTAPKI